MNVPVPDKGRSLIRIQGEMIPTREVDCAIFRVEEVHTEEVDSVFTDGDEH
jgi:hypothetical protein